MIRTCQRCAAGASARAHYCRRCGGRLVHIRHDALGEALRQQIACRAILRRLRKRKYQRRRARELAKHRALYRPAALRRRLPVRARLRAVRRACVALERRRLVAFAILWALVASQIHLQLSLAQRLGLFGVTCWIAAFCVNYVRSARVLLAELLGDD